MHLSSYSFIKSVSVTYELHKNKILFLMLHVYESQVSIRRSTARLRYEIHCHFMKYLGKLNLNHPVYQKGCQS